MCDSNAIFSLFREKKNLDKPELEPELNKLTRNKILENFGGNCDLQSDWKRCAPL